MTAIAAGDQLGPVHPGEIIREEFLAPWGIWAVIEGRAPITPEIAATLSERFGCSDEFWLGLQADYDKASK